MARKWDKVSICWYITTLFIVLTLLPVWYFWMPLGVPSNLTTIQRSKRKLDSGHSTVPISQSVPWILEWTYNHSITLTVPPSTSTAVEIPITSLKGFRNTVQITGEAWRGYWWYMTGNALDLNWDSLITTQQGNYWPSGKSKEAVFFKDKVTLTKQGDLLKLTFALPDGILRPPNATIFNVSCWGFLLWAWSSGPEPHFPVVICENTTMGQLDQPILNNYTRTIKVTAISVPLNSVDGLFRVTTGVTGDSNNWLLLTEEAAKTTKENCVVCMGPRPLLRVVPANIDTQCVMELMNKTLPSRNCSKWDKIHPLVRWQKDKPLFSNQVAKGNFTCINITGNNGRLGRLNHAQQCQSLIFVGSSFWPQSRGDIWWWCGDDRIFDKLPLNQAGYCALISLLLPIKVFPTTVHVLM
ncbi:uncharacterized protein LOC133481354 [Phyllopteryx taeniolatus]|uniref:uncharacterized protein LOC133481354 n=1 Tax=Phyllopteryx taeniolatus TaxID=161469 RepID=UPI002AD2203B|nr:uncharacterized protein LOC133481354 [Phyllopteryx taeniolatus]